MKEHMKRRISRWSVRLILMVLLAFMCASLFYFRDFKLNGLWLKKRVAIYMLPTVLTFGLCFFFPRTEKKCNSRLLRVLLMISGIVLSTFMFQRMTWGVIWGYPISFKEQYILLNTSIVAILAVMIWLIAWDIRIVVPIVYWVLFFCGYFYRCVYLFRGVAVKPMDLLTINTALAVASQYHFPIKTQTVFWAAFGICLSVVCSWFPQKRKDRVGVIIKFGSAIMAGIWLSILFFSPLVEQVGLTTTAFEKDAELFNATQGTLATLAKEVWNLREIKPDDYQVSKLQDADQRLFVSGSSASSEQKPNVIIIVNESLSDVNSLWQIDLENGDPLKYIHSLKNNAVYGNLYVSIYGGSTCNTEHNFLTATPPTPRLYMPLFPTVREDTPSLIWQMKAQGYSTYALHPEKPDNYQRDKIYPRLGFDTFYSIESFQDAERLRGWVSDQATYDAIVSLLENKEENDPLLIYALTIQNHGAYHTELIPKAFKVENQDIPSTVKDGLEEYLTLVDRSDKAFKWLISYFEEFEEPTLVVMFGDHQPNLDLTGIEKSEKLTEMEDALTQYITPFVIWANYPIKSEYVEAISVNYLASLMLEKGGLPLTNYNQWQLDIMEKYPVVVQLGYADKDANFISWNEGTWPEELRLMNYLRYNSLYDVPNRLPALEIER